MTTGFSPFVDGLISKDAYKYQQTSFDSDAMSERGPQWSLVPIYSKIVSIKWSLEV